MTDDDVDSPWAATVADAERIADELSEAGFETVLAFAGATGPNRGDTPGLVYVITGDTVDELADSPFEEATKSDIYVATANGRTYLVTVLRASDRDVAAVVVGSILSADLRSLREPALEADAFRTELRRMDGTTIVEFHHDDPEPFFP